MNESYIGSLRTRRLELGGLSGWLGVNRYSYCSRSFGSLGTKYSISRRNPLQLT